jgi:hypothetical protein
MSTQPQPKDFYTAKCYIHLGFRKRITHLLKPSTVHIERDYEIPYIMPIDDVWVLPHVNGYPEFTMDVLKQGEIYLWVIDDQYRLIVARERKWHGRWLKHGDIFIRQEKEQPHRPPACMGGEMNYDYELDQWVLDNNSSYSFYRTDNREYSYCGIQFWFYMVQNIMYMYHFNFRAMMYFDHIKYKDTIRNQLRPHQCL